MFNLIVMVLVSFTFFTENWAIENHTSGNSGQLDPIPYFAHLEAEVMYYGLLGKRSCGAVIIDDLWLITSAYCLNNADRLTVELGSSRTNVGSKPSHMIITVEKSNFYQHPRYNKMMSWNDIGLILLPERIEFSESIYPVRVPKTCETPQIGDAIAVGYEINNSLLHTPQLQSIRMKTLPNSSCGRWFFVSKHRSSIICANIPDQPMWNGEKGSPLIKNDTLIGVLSFEWRGGPNRFTRACSYLDWIGDIKTGKKMEFLSDEHFRLNYLQFNGV